MWEQYGWEWEMCGQCRCRKGNGLQVSCLSCWFASLQWNRFCIDRYPSKHVVPLRLNFNRVSVIYQSFLKHLPVVTNWLLVASSKKIDLIQISFHNARTSIIHLVLFCILLYSIQSYYVTDSKEKATSLS